MKTVAPGRVLTIFHGLMLLVVVVNSVVGCSTISNETTAIVQIGTIVEIHDVAPAPEIIRRRSPNPLFPGPATPENIAKVRKSMIDSGQKPFSDEIIQLLIEWNSYSPQDIAAEPDHKLYIVESVQRTKFYVRSTQVFVVGACVEIRPQPAHREKNSWLLGEATVKASTRC